MAIEVNTGLNTYAFTWRDINSFTPLDGCYYCLLVFMRGESVPRETYIGIACNGQYHVELPDDIHTIDPCDQDDQILILAHPLPKLNYQGEQ